MYVCVEVQVLHICVVLYLSELVRCVRVSLDVCLCLEYLCEYWYVFKDVVFVSRNHCCKLILIIHSNFALVLIHTHTLTHPYTHMRMHILYKYSYTQHTHTLVLTHTYLT